MFENFIKEFSPRASHQDLILSTEAAHQCWQQHAKASWEGTGSRGLRLGRFQVGWLLGCLLLWHGAGAAGRGWGSAGLLAADVAVHKAALCRGEKPFLQAGGPLLPGCTISVQIILF